jgi:hypothetical protein
MCNVSKPYVALCVGEVLEGPFDERLAICTCRGQQVQCLTQPRFGLAMGSSEHVEGMLSQGQVPNMSALRGGSVACSRDFWRCTAPGR